MVLSNFLEWWSLCSAYHSALHILLSPAYEIEGDIEMALSVRPSFRPSFRPSPAFSQ